VPQRETTSQTRTVDDCNTEKGMKEMKKQAIGSVIDGREDC
jgi:hypothetical protein